MNVWILLNTGTNPLGLRDYNTYDDFVNASSLMVNVYLNVASSQKGWESDFGKKWGETVKRNR